MYTENGGTFVCKTRHLQLAGGNKNSANSSVGSMFTRIHSPQYILLVIEVVIMEQVEEVVVALQIVYHEIGRFLEKVLKLQVYHTRELLVLSRIHLKVQLELSYIRLTRQFL